MLIKDFGHSKELFKVNLQNIVKKLDNVNQKSNTKLEPFVFVKIWSLLN